MREDKRTGISVRTDTLLVVATVNPVGHIKFAMPQFMKVDRHQCATTRRDANASAGTGSIQRAARRGG